ncbi:hypothetical protein BGZ83_003055, partial [Gryganskiella cystojenkinii]
GATAIPGQDCVKGCTNNAASADTCNLNCDCKKAFDTCGSDFDPACNMVPDTIYTCPAGVGVPVAGVDCTYGCLDNGFYAADTCKPIPPYCTCKKTSDTCGSTFDASCKLVATKLYTCTAAGAVPAPGADCTNGCVANGVSASDTCQPIPPDCSCRNVFDTCGSVFDPACNMVKTKLYTCTAAGAAPTPSTDCVAGCADNGATAADTCKPDCSCKKASDTCGSTFDLACNLAKTKLYTCTAAGAVPTPGADCANGCTDNGATAADSCKPDCKCKDEFDTCGSALDPACQKDNKTLYSCSGAGADPVSTQICDGICVQVAGKNDECRCMCTDDGSVCGSAFAATCNLPPNTLYKCTKGNEPVIDKACNPGTCSVNVVKGICSENVDKGTCSVNVIKGTCPANVVLGSLTPFDTGDFQAEALTDFCIDQCACKEAGVTMCADAFPPRCNYKNGTLMNCAAINAVPTVNQNCTNGCIVQPGADVCRPDPCACQNAGDTCSSGFPANCSYDANTLYTCTGKDVIPQKKKTCQSNEICTVVAGGDDFCGKNDNCKCVGTGTICGSDFPPNCNKITTSVYTCPAGTETPCPNGCANGVCVTDCFCKVDGNVCGSSFPPKCNLQPNAVYKCVKAQAPLLDSHCGLQACVASACQDPCLCKSGNKVCASTFPPSCRLSNTSLYTCTAAGAIPSNPKNCTAGCELTRPDNRCQSPCAQPAKDAASAINNVVQTLTGVLGKSSADNVSTVELPVLIKLFTDLSTNLTKAADDEAALFAISYSVNMTANAGFMILRSGLFWNFFQNATRDALVPVNTTQQAQMVALLNTLISCTGSTAKDCSAINALYKEFVRVATPVIAAYTTP